ncbi:MAG: hypothetical protein HYY97_03350 [Rhodocyclales bacterium]|nr:hypothetical protein [Rhodocyclales bacterium]
MEVKQSFCGRRRLRFRLLLETSKTPTGSMEFYQMIKGRFSPAAPQVLFRRLVHVIFAAGAQNAEPAFQARCGRLAGRRPLANFASPHRSWPAACVMSLAPDIRPGPNNPKFKKIREGDIQ